LDNWTFNGVTKTSKNVFNCVLKTKKEIYLKPHEGEKVMTEY